MSTVFAVRFEYAPEQFQYLYFMNSIAEARAVAYKEGMINLSIEEISLDSEGKVLRTRIEYL